MLELRHSNQRLSRSEYQGKVEAAHRASTTAELEALLRDSGAPPVPVRRAELHVASSELELDPSDEQGFVFALMSGAKRKGNWEPPARLAVGAVMGGVDLDFRDADLLEGVTEVYILTVMGGVNIVVPPDLDVDANGLGLLGGFAHLSRRSGDPDGPLLKIKGLAVMGGVSVKVK